MKCFARPLHEFGWSFTKYHNTWSKKPLRGGILGRNWEKKVLRVFLLAIHSQLYTNGFYSPPPPKKKVVRNWFVMKTVYSIRSWIRLPVYKFSYNSIITLHKYMITWIFLNFFKNLQEQKRSFLEEKGAGDSRNSRFS